MTAAVPLGTLGPMAEIGQLIGDLRERLKLSQDAVAKRSRGLARQDVGRVESGERKASTTRVRDGLARGLGLRREDFDAYLSGEIDVEEAARRSLPESDSSVTLDRSAADAPAPSDDETPLDRAIIHAWTAATMAIPDSYSVADMTNARAAARSISRLASADIDLEASARTYLEAARKVRKAGGTPRPADLVVAVRDEAMAMLLPVRRDVLEEMKRTSAAAGAKLSEQFEAGTLPAGQDPMAKLRALEEEGRAREQAGIPAPIRVEPVHEGKQGPAGVGPGKKGRGK